MSHVDQNGGARLVECSASAKNAARILAAALLLLVAGEIARAQSSYAMVMDAVPLAAEIGKTSEHEVHSRYTLEGAYQVIVAGSGVRGEIVPVEAPPVKPAGKNSKPPAKPEAKKPLTTIKVRFSVDASALPGVRDFRIVTSQAASTVGQLVLVRDPVVREQPKNDTPALAQPIALPATICGAIERAEDVDYYKFRAAAGQSLIFLVRSARCQDRIHDLQIHCDPIISLRNSSGTVLAASDNYFFADPLLAYKFSTAGDYFLEVRDVRYQGNTYWQYSIEINDRPLVTNVFPTAITPEKPTRVELVGYNLPAGASATLTLPGNLADGPTWADVGLKPAVHPAPIIVSRLAEVRQKPGNHALETAQPITIPCGVNGRISSPGQSDFYRFEAKKGQRFSFEVVARRHESALDPLLTVYNETGSRLVENDDMLRGRTPSADAELENWTAPADGRYVLALRDLHLGGGPPFVYYLKAEPAEPHFLLELDSDKTVLAPGLGAALFVRAFRKNGFSGDIALACAGMPKGVTATCGRILDGASDGVIVLTAAKDAPRGSSELKITGRATFTADGASRELRAEALPLQETYLPGGGRGLYPVELHTCSVGEPMDILSVKISPADVRLKPGGSQTVQVSIERAAGFEQNVTLDVMSRHLGSIYGSSLPAGVKLDDKKSKTLLNGKLSQGSIVLVADADAKPVEKQVVPVIANVSINFVMKMSYAAPPLTLSVEKK